MKPAQDHAPDQFLPFAMPDIGDEEIAGVVECMKSGWLTTGPRTRRFEASFAEYIGARHALAVNSATAGMHLALEAMGIGPGDRVLTTPYTFTSTAEVVRYLGADPVFADIDPVTMNIDPDAVDAALARDPSIKVLMPVHLAGLSCDMGPLMTSARRHGTLVLEDAAHALPTTCQGRTIGTIGDATVFSFYATKTIATGEGGMIVTDDDAIAKRASVMRLHGIDRDVFDRYSSDKPSWYYEVVAPGFKYNMTDIAAAIGLAQLSKVEVFRNRRAAIAERYRQAFADLPVTLPTPGEANEKHAWHLFILRLNVEALDIDRNTFIERLTALGIGTSVHFIPLHLQPYWRDRYGLSAADFPVATRCFERAVSLPMYTRMSDDDVERVIRAVRTTLLAAAR